MICRASSRKKSTIHCNYCRASSQKKCPARQRESFIFFTTYRTNKRLVDFLTLIPYIAQLWKAPLVPTSYKAFALDIVAFSVRCFHKQPLAPLWVSAARPAAPQRLKFIDVTHLLTFTELLGISTLTINGTSEEIRFTSISTERHSRGSGTTCFDGYYNLWYHLYRSSIRMGCDGRRDRHRLRTDEGRRSATIASAGHARVHQHHWWAGNRLWTVLSASYT